METKYNRLWTLFGMVWVVHTVTSDHEDATSGHDAKPGKEHLNLFGRSNLLGRT